jgi:hypothetical protein
LPNENINVITQLDDDFDVITQLDNDVDVSPSQIITSLTSTGKVKTFPLSLGIIWLDDNIEVMICLDNNLDVLIWRDYEVVLNIWCHHLAE